MLQSSGKLAKSGISKDKKSIKKIHIAQCRTKGFGKHSREAGCIFKHISHHTSRAQINRARPNATDPLPTSFPGNLGSNRAHHTSFSTYNPIRFSQATGLNNILVPEALFRRWALRFSCKVSEAKSAMETKMITSLLL